MLVGWLPWRHGLLASPYGVLVALVVMAACLYLQDSKRAFLHDCVNEGDEKEKLETFINFCEDTIFEVKPNRPVASLND